MKDKQTLMSGVSKICLYYLDAVNHGYSEIMTAIMT